MPNLIDILSSRGLLSSTTHPLPLLRHHFSTPRTLYAGFDPTAPSLHIGNLLVLLVLAHAQRCGHRVIGLVGGATALIGDPSGRSTERPFLSPQQIHHNALGIQRSIAQVLSFQQPQPAPHPSAAAAAASPQPALLLNNLDWFAELPLLTFLRDTGTHFRLSTLLSKSSIASRLAPPSSPSPSPPGPPPSPSSPSSPSFPILPPTSSPSPPHHGLSYTEFSYQLLQAYDFLHLHSAYGCTAQVGGSDQWGNITSGLDLIARKGGGEVFGLTLPLLTTSAGEKLGKSAGNAVWLSADLTSPYELYQHFLHTHDTDVDRFLSLFSLSHDTPHVQADSGEGGGREGVRRLARQVVRLVHGEEGLRQAEERTRALFEGGGEGVEGVKRPRAEVVGHSVVDLLMAVGAVSSRNEARRLIKEGGCYLHGERVKDDRALVGEGDVRGGAVVVRVGKKRPHVVSVVE